MFLLSFSNDLSKNMASALLAGPFRRGVLLHSHAPTYAQKRLEVSLIARANQTFDYTFLLPKCMCLIKICAYSHVTIVQTAVIHY